ncbi:formin-like protein 13 [Pistacia vera]|uniref:formin-like protein 13 n=1 Tax=Pistacia vera TaxID=55513 RepID=UPI001263BA6F|nr:formin-like protein 13 [Pistacia vera]
MNDVSYLFTFFFIHGLLLSHTTFIVKATQTVSLDTTPSHHVVFGRLKVVPSRVRRPITSRPPPPVGNVPLHQSPPPPQWSPPDPPIYMVMASEAVSAVSHYDISYKLKVVSKKKPRRPPPSPKPNSPVHNRRAPSPPPPPPPPYPSIGA